jgi:putative addiction module CopG family antidote
MEVELSDRARRVIEQQVADGDFANAGEAIEESVRLLEEQHDAYIADVNATLDEAYPSIERGDVRDDGPAMFERIRERVRRKTAATLDEGDR